jgi:hypothetical protein
MFQLRFFTFKEIALPKMQLYHPNYSPENMQIEPNKFYYLRKEVSKLQSVALSRAQ